MSQSTGTQRTEAVQQLFEVLIRFSRSLRARGADWSNVVQDLSRGDILTLGVLEAKGSIRPGHIALALSVDPSVISRQLSGLHRLGLIERGTDPEDGRAELITLSDQGRARLLDARTAVCAVLAERLDHWDLDDIVSAASMVGELDDRLHEPVPAPPSRAATPHAPPPHAPPEPSASPRSAPPTPTTTTHSKKDVHV